MCARGRVQQEEWLYNFEKTVQGENADNIVKHLDIVATCPDGNCGCEQLPDMMAWYHANHREFNWAVWDTIVSRPGLLEKLRYLVQKDVNLPDRWVGSEPKVACGRLFTKRFGRQLLDHFLLQQPDPTWVDV